MKKWIGLAMMLGALTLLTTACGAANRNAQTPTTPPAATASPTATATAAATAAPTEAAATEAPAQ